MRHAKDYSPFPCPIFPDYLRKIPCKSQGKAASVYCLITCIQETEQMNLQCPVSCIVLPICRLKKRLPSGIQNSTKFYKVGFPDYIIFFCGVPILFYTPHTISDPQLAYTQKVGDTLALPKNIWGLRLQSLFWNTQYYLGLICNL